jgi:thiamine biosynthesis protein ThiI
MEVVVVHYNEVALKLGHRSMFVARLAENLRRALADFPTAKVELAEGRIVATAVGVQSSEVTRRLAVVPGVANLMPAQRLEASMPALEQATSALLENWRPAGSFCVKAKRSDKRFPLKSPDIAARLGAMIVARTGAEVRLKGADTTVYVEITSDAAFLGLGKVAACGGLPVSTGGRVLLLLSGGIDSPVAGLRMMRRGCRVDALHFHSVPYLDRSSQDKARRLAAVLARGQGPVRLSMVAFGPVQSQIVRFVPRPLRVVLYRRMMMRIASRMARRAGLAALVTGESLGQVASQTMTNMAVIAEAATVPVLRPLVGMDKLEITDYARRADTYPISIIPDQDCCSLFVPKHPATAASLAEVARAEEELDVEGLVGVAVDGAVGESVEAEWDGYGEGLAAAGL